MATKFGFEVNLGAAGAPRDGLLRRSDKMRILVLGDFSGRHNRGLETAADLAGRAILPVDLDRFDAVFRRLSPSLSLGTSAAATAGLDVKFDEFEDFHPDRLYAALTSAADACCSEVLDAIRHSVSEFTQGAEQADDITVLVLGYAGEPPPSSY